MILSNDSPKNNNFVLMSKHISQYITCNYSLYKSNRKVITHTYYLFQKSTREMLYKEKLFLNMISVHRISCKTFHTNRTRAYIIDKYQSLKYNYQYLNFNNKISCIGNGELSYFNNDRKIQILYIQKEIFLLKYIYFSSFR